MCEGCGFRQTVFPGLPFCQWLLDESNKNAIVIAHNAKAYDNYFIYAHLLQLGQVPENVIFSGTKIMFMKVGKKLNIQFIDSINFLPMALAKLPKSFGLTELKKGYFPHLFNTFKNWNVKRQGLPNIECYLPDTMGVE